MLLLKKPGFLGHGGCCLPFCHTLSPPPPPPPPSTPLVMALSSSSRIHHPQQQSEQQHHQQHYSSPSPLHTDLVTTYHDETKHSFRKYARGPHGLDWANQPNPFRRYWGAPVVLLDHLPPTGHDSSNSEPLYFQPFSDISHPQSLSKVTLSQLLYDSLALSAWKTTGFSTWSLRVNPSSGNLHPTEGYVISGPVSGVSDSPFIAHYAPKEHALEMRAEFPPDLWHVLTEGFPLGTIFVGFTSIFWRESWKYGERAFRYCNHDVGHAIAAVSIAAASLGWDSLLLDGWGNIELEHLLGLAGQKEVSTSGTSKGYFPEVEQEHADCLLAIIPRRIKLEVISPSRTLASTIPSRLAGVEWKGQPNALSKEHVRWGIIYKTATASRKPTTGTSVNVATETLPQATAFNQLYEPLTIREVVRKRRSAVDMDGITSMQRDAFYQILLKATASGPESFSQGMQYQLPFRVLPWKAELHLALFVHRIIGLKQGLYFLVRNSDHEKDLRRAMRPDFKWEKPEGCPEGLPLYRLASGDCRMLAMRLSCNQEIAGDSCFSLGMIARFEPAILERGSWMYPRLFWETGVLGQLLYLEAHALGISATGIGCYFDDAVHEALGLSGKEFQSLYHFTVGAPVLDKRIMNLPAYPGPAADS